ncbi:MAG: PRC and DUF2382 domain-containing protein [Thermoleophilia bacterium]|nr:PRC and DUF2382 domain-containing protein [Thermoleophilia bacterium]
MADTTTVDRLARMRGSDVFSSEGEKIGSIEELFVDEQTGEPEWIGLGIGFFGSKRVLVPVQGADVREDGVTVPYSKDQVKETPDIDSDEISQETEERLYAHYGLSYSEERSDSGLPPGGPRVDASDVADVGTESESVTRSEEELRVGKMEREAGRARLRKWVETEPVQMDVDLKRETARVTREPVDEPAAGADIGEAEIEVPLRAEEAVVEKQTVAKERIGLEKDVEVERETVSEEVRKERVDVDGEGSLER